MKEYNCLMIDENGKKLRDRILAESESHAIEIIEEKCCIPVEIKSRRTTSFIKNKKSPDMLEYLKLLQQLLESGLTVSECLELIKEMKGTKKSVRCTAKKILSEIKKGISYSESIKKCPDFFSQTCISMTQIGDKSGNLGSIMKHMIHYVENRIKMEEKIRSSLLYPTAVLISAIIMMAVSIIFVFPCLEDVLTAFSMETYCNFKEKIRIMKTAAIIFVAASFILSFFCIIILKNNNSKLRFFRDKILLRLPAIGKIILLQDSVNLAFSMEAMLSCKSFTVGLALEESEKTVENYVLKNDIARIRELVVSGKSLSDSFSSSDWFSDNFSKWIAVGEKNGQSEITFRQIRKSLETDMDRSLKTLMELIEPAVTMFTGLLILASVFTFIIPMFEAMGSL